MSTSAMDAFTCFHQSSVLHKAVVTAMAMHLLDNTQIMDTKSSFTAMDYDGNGGLSKSELCTAVAQRAHGTASPDIASWIELIFDSIDTDGSGEIEYTEYLAAVLKEGSSRSQQAVEAAFRVFDVDQSGKVSAQEFARVITMMPEDIVECMVQFDADGDGELSLDEFKKIVGHSSVSKQQASQPLTCLSRAISGGKKQRRTFSV
jgi:calcium-dependent protein kinase